MDKIDRPGGSLPYISPDSADNTEGSAPASAKAAGEPPHISQLPLDAIQRFQDLIKGLDSFFEPPTKPPAAMPGAAPAKGQDESLTPLEASFKERWLSASLGKGAATEEGAAAERAHSAKGQAGEDVEFKKAGGGKNKKIAGDSVKSETIEEGHVGTDPKVSTKKAKNPAGAIDWERGQTIVEGKWRWEGADMKQSVSRGWGTVTHDESLNLVSVRGRVFGEAGLRDNALRAGIGAQAAFELIGVHEQFKYDAPKVTLAGHDTAIHAAVNADGYVGASGQGELSVTIGQDTSVVVGGEAFAGASASVTGSASLGDFAEVHGTAAAWAGAGVEGLFQISFEDGVFSFDSGLGAAVLYGGSADWGFSVNFIELGAFAGDAIKQTLENPGAWLDEFAADLGALTGGLFSATEDIGNLVFGAMDYLFSSSPGSGVPSESSLPPPPTTEERLEDKRSQRPSAPAQ